jgi:hypothetical protein
MSDPVAVLDKRRPINLWLIAVIGLAVLLFGLAGSAFIPHINRQRLVRRLEALGCTVTPKEVEPFLIPIDRIPGFEGLKTVPFELWADEKASPEQCGEILRIAADVTTIRSLQLTNTPTTDEHLRVLDSGTELQWLNLTNTRVTNQSLEFLRAATHLNMLVLTNCDVDDAGIVEISKMSRLEFLELAGTKITNAGLEELKSLKNLRYLSLSNTQVSESAVKELVRVLPLLEVTDD